MGVVKLSTAGLNNFAKYSSMTAGNPGPSFFLSYYTHTLETNLAQMGSDSQGSMYAICSTAEGTAGVAPPNRVFKQTVTGEISLQRTVFYNTASGQNDGGARGIAVNPNGEFFTHARSREGGQLQGLTFKADSAGSLVAQRLHFMGNTTLAGRMAAGSTRVSIATEVLQNGYVHGIYSYDQSLSLQWHQWSNTGQSNFDSHTAVDSENNTYYFTGIAQGDFGNFVNYRRPTVVKFNSSGVVQWQRRLPDVTRGQFTNGTVDSSGNVYAVGYYNANNANVASAIISKYDSAGNLQWTKSLQSSGSASFDAFRSVAIGPDGNLYVVGSATDASGVVRPLIASYTPSDTLRWQRFLRRSDNLAASGQQIVISGNAIGVGLNVRNAANTFSLPMIARLPLDGSLTGTYNIAGLSMVYEAANLSNSGFGLSNQTGEFVFSQRSVTDSAASRTLVAASTTNTLLNIG